MEAAATLQARLHLPLGDIAPEAVFELAAAVEAARGEIRLGVCHDLFLLAETAPSLSPRLASLADGQPLCACPGATWCNRGLVDSRAAAGRLRAAMPSGCALTVGIAGCPNNCAQAATADIGLIGRLVRRDGGELVEGFRLFAGGGKGETTGLAQELHPGLPADAACDAAAWLAGEYHRVAAGRGTSFAEFVTASNAGLREELARRFVS